VVADFRLLGSIEARVSGQVVDTGQPRQRTVLVALLVDAGAVVPWETLIDRVWGDAPPAHARDSVRAHVARLRAAFARIGTAGDMRVGFTHRAGGYVIDVPPETVDVHRFARLVADARSAPAGGLDRLREALALWRGEPLLGLSGEWVLRMRRTWRDRYLTAVIEWADAELRHHNGHMVTAAVSEMTDEHPLDERLAAVYMRALSDSGRSAEALRHFDAMRRRLRDELGADPSRELQSIHQAVLHSAGPDRERGTTTSASPRPQLTMLPPLVRSFVGRNKLLVDLDALRHDLSDARGETIMVVSGMAGVGKTTLAIQWAHRVRDSFPDGQIYVDLRGHDVSGSPVPREAAVRTLLEALGVAGDRIPAGLDARTSLFQRLLVDRRILLILDNARDSDQVRSLLPGASTVRVLVTSRDPLGSLVVSHGARPLHVGLFTKDEAWDLLERGFGRDRMEAEPTAVRDIIAICSGLPLALAVASARGAIHTHFSLTELVAELRGLGGPLTTLASEDPSTDLRTVFSWSYRALGAAAAAVFRRLGLHCGPDISVTAVAAVAALAVTDARALLSEIARAQLIVEHRPGRYLMHDLVRAYATDLVHARQSAAENEATVSAALDFYLRTALAADHALDPSRDQIGAAPQGLGPAPVPDPPAALEWFAAERDVLLAVLADAQVRGWDEQYWLLAWSMTTFLHRRGHWQDWAGIQRVAVAAARRLGRPLWQAISHRLLANALTRLSSYEDALSHYHDALALFEKLDDSSGKADVHRCLSMYHGAREEFEDALFHSWRAYHLYRDAGRALHEAKALNGVGWYQAHLGRYEQALTSCQAALRMLGADADQRIRALTLHSVGYAHHQLRHHAEAVRCYQEVLLLYREQGDRYYEADTMAQLGDIHAGAGDSTAALDVWRQAVRILDDLHHPDAARLRHKIHEHSSVTTPGNSS
jgi:DNA-binding SARP family transcriptional activator/tetratricopeptide (TPR) repeat protein